MKEKMDTVSEYVLGLKEELEATGTISIEDLDMVFGMLIYASDELIIASEQLKYALENDGDYLEVRRCVC